MAQQPIDDDRIESFEAALQGSVIRPDDADYDDARSVWNGMVGKYPALIVRCRGVGDVISAVNFARENDLLVAVRGGGHDVAGTAVCDDGLVIDLSEIKAVRVGAMSEREIGDREESTAIREQSSTIEAALASSLVVPLGVPLFASAPDGFGPAIATVGLVLAEALVLYVGYGALTRAISPAARELLGSH